MITTIIIIGNKEDIVGLYLGIEDLLRFVLGGGVSRLELLFILLRILTVILCRSSRGIPIINNAD